MDNTDIIKTIGDANEFVLDYKGDNRSKAEEKLKKIVSDVLKENIITWSKQFLTIPVKAEKLILDMGNDITHDEIMELKRIIEYNTEWKIENILELRK